ncbi:MAG: hypothetical protein R3B68_00710 [Phycisphaerales bacterium]
MATPTTQTANGQYTAQGTPINGAAFTNPFASQINAQAGSPVNGVNGQVGVNSGTQVPGQIGNQFNGFLNGQYGVPFFGQAFGQPFGQTLGQPGFGFPVASPFGAAFNGLVNGQFGNQFGNQFGTHFGTQYPTSTGGFQALPFGYANTNYTNAFNPYAAFNTAGYPAFGPFTNPTSFNTTGFNTTGNGFTGVSPFIAGTPFAQYPTAGVPFGTTGFNGVTPFNGVPFNTLPYAGQFNSIPTPFGWNTSNVWNATPAINAWGQNAWGQNAWGQNVWGQNTPSINNWNTGLLNTGLNNTGLNNIGLFNSTWGLHNQVPFGVSPFSNFSNTYPQHTIHTGSAFVGTPWTSQALGTYGRPLTTPSTFAGNTGFTGFNAPAGIVPSFYSPLFNTPFNTINTPWTNAFQNLQSGWNGLNTWNQHLNTLGTVPSIYATSPFAASPYSTFPFATTPWNSIPGGFGVNPWTINNAFTSPINGVWPTGARFGTSLPIGSQFANQFTNQYPGLYAGQIGTQFGIQNCNTLGGDCACPPNVCIPGFQSTAPLAGIQNSGAYGLPYNTILPTGVNPSTIGFNTLPTISNVLGTGILGSGTIAPTHNAFWQNALAFSQAATPFNPFATNSNQTVPFVGGTSTFNPYATTGPVLNGTPIGNGFYSTMFGVPSFGIPSYINGYVPTSPTGSVLTSVAGGVNAINGFGGFPYASNPNNPFAPSAIVTNPVTGQVGGQSIGANGQTAGASLVGCCREAA